jgi:hypothetical protein
MPVIFILHTEDVSHVRFFKYVQYLSEESVNRSQMDIQRKTSDIQTWGGGGEENIYFSTNPPHLPHRFISASNAAFV